MIAIDDSILASIRKQLGPESEADGFDGEIKRGINSAIAILAMNGVGPNPPIYVVDETAKWSDLTADEYVLSFAQDYVFLSTKQGFDPSSTSFVNQAQSEKMEKDLWYVREWLEYKKVIEE